MSLEGTSRGHVRASSPQEVIVVDAVDDLPPPVIDLIGESDERDGEGGNLPGAGEGDIVDVSLVEPLQTFLPGDEEVAVTVQVAWDAELQEKEEEQLANDSAIIDLLEEEEKEVEEEEEEVDINYLGISFID